MSSQPMSQLFLDRFFQHEGEHVKFSSCQVSMLSLEFHAKGKLSRKEINQIHFA